jgi:hypothetical protein
MVGYVTLEEANTYIAQRYASANADRLRWESLGSNDRSAYLQQSFDAIENLVYPGRPLSVEQTTAFPRSWELAVSDKVKYAQIENALKLSDDLDTEDYNRMRLLGITRYSIGDLSETLSPGTQSNTAAAGIVSMKTMNYLKPYLYGGFRV